MGHRRSFYHTLSLPRPPFPPASRLTLQSPSAADPASRPHPSATHTPHPSWPLSSASDAFASAATTRSSTDGPLRYPARSPEMFRSSKLKSRLAPDTSNILPPSLSNTSPAPHFGSPSPATKPGCSAPSVRLRSETTQAQPSPGYTCRPSPNSAVPPFDKS